jgi:Bacteriocin-protection, YdeI or OmpD-Associated/Domain of unknown function (DUF1905)
MRLRAELVSHGGNTAGFVVPEGIVETLGGGRRPKVVVTLGGHTWRSSITFMGGQFLLGVSMANRTAAGATTGETYDVDVTLDAAPRVVAVPEDLAEALDATPGARAAWDGLSYSHQRAHVEPILAAKKPETRARRITATIDLLTTQG